jgi:hypothetical protein
MVRGSLMAYTSAKNLPLTPALQDLGLGDALKQSLEDNEEELRRRRQEQLAATGQYSPAAQVLFGGGVGSGGM